MSDLFIYSFYKFTKVKNKKQVKLEIEKFIKNKVVRGTILIADEGINGSISADTKTLTSILKYIKKLLFVRQFEIKINQVDFLPFNRIKIRVKNEIVSLGKEINEFNKKKGLFIEPSDWNNFIIQKDVKLIDLRNDYEIEIGKFKRAINPRTKTFREFPKNIENMNLNKNDKIAIYCTGGIRCEKASKYLFQEGYNKIYQLKGGILNYLDYTKNSKAKSLWTGDCFVFDNRVTVNKKLVKGKYDQCHGCRHPINKKDTKSYKYIKGVSCPKCYGLRSKEQKQNSFNRQKQIEAAEYEGRSHPFKKIRNL